MGMNDLEDFEKKLYEYIKENDFETKKWDSKETARHFGVEVDEIYTALSNMSKHIKDKIYIHYKDKGLRISAE